MTRKSARDVDEAAAGWAARQDRGLTPEEQTAFEAFLAADARAPGAYARMRAMALASERARSLNPGFQPSHFAPPPASRRSLLKIGTAIAATGAVAAVASNWRRVLPAPHFATGKGETKVVALEDGSVVTLNTETELAVEFDRAQRGIRLLKGEALFDVAKDAGRAFLVTAGDTRVRVVGTSFSVRRLEETPVQVLVREGLVEVFKPESRARPLLIAANTRAVAIPEQGDIVAARVGDAELSREMAWRDGRIAFEGQTLAAAASEFARYSDTRIIVDDPILAREEIAGLFKATDPVGFARTVAISLNAHTEIRAGEVHLTR